MAKNILLSLHEQGVQVSLILIPAHKSIAGNELADSFAKKATRSGQPLSIGVPLGKVKRYWKDTIKAKSLDCCLQEAPCRGSLYCDRYFDRFRYAWFEFLSARRRTVTFINRLRSGHTLLRASLHRFFIVNSSSCFFCGLEEITNHVFLICLQYAEQRRLLQRDICRLRGMLSHLIEYLLASLDEDIVHVLDRFICNILLHI